jgi:magnesium transporter
MISSFFRGADGRLESPAGEGTMRDALARGDGVLWVDLEAPTREEAAFLSEVFAFHHLAIDDCFNAHVDPAKIDDYGEYIFVIAQAISYEAQSERLEATELDLFLGHNYVVSFHARPLPFVDALRRRCAEQGPELARGADFLAHALLETLVDDYQPAVEALDDTLSRLEELVLAEPQSSFLQDILLLKRNVQRLRRTILPQRDVINRVARGEFPQVVRPDS